MMKSSASTTSTTVLIPQQLTEQVTKRSLITNPAKNLQNAVAEVLEASFLCYTYFKDRNDLNRFRAENR